jgi:hypothetical protein
MASASEPPHITQLLHVLRPLCSGISLCGAGAGGFVVLVLKTSSSLEDVEQRTASYAQLTGVELSVHRATINSDGTTSRESGHEEHLPLHACFGGK